MMNAVQWWEEAERMCKNYKSCNDSCPAYGNYGCKLKPYALDFDPDEVVRIVEEWSKAHPIQTNAQKFEEVFGSISLLYEMFDFNSNDYGVHHSMWWNAPYEPPKGE